MKIRVTGLPESMGNVADINRPLLENDFYSDAKINKELQEDIVTDVDDVKARLEEVRIECRKCNDYIILNF